MMEIKLYEIAPALHDALYAEEFDEQAVNDLAIAFEEKAGGIVRFTQQLDGAVAMFKAEEARLADRRRALENRMESVKSYLKRCMEAAEIAKLDLGTVTVAVQKSPESVVVEDEASLPAEYVVIKQITQIDKAGIKSALKGGQAVPGARLEAGTHLRIR